MADRPAGNMVGPAGLELPARQLAASDGEARNPKAAGSLAPAVPDYGSAHATERQEHQRHRPRARGGPRGRRGGGQGRRAPLRHRPPAGHHPEARRSRASATATRTVSRSRTHATLARLRALAIPPAWTEVWICPDPRGHLQATGRDARGRKQYRYHDEWRAIRRRAQVRSHADLRRAPCRRSGRASTPICAGTACRGRRCWRPSCVCSRPP